jgi:hypothetical protein
MKRILIILSLIATIPLTVKAQWSSNPLQNLGIGVGTGEQSIPKIAATSDSGCYLSWFDSRSGGYCVYMQRLNALGVPQWTTNGLLISSHPQSTSLVNYDLTVDPFDNAVVVFTDTRNGGSTQLDVFAYKISPAGTFLWGANGIGLSAAGNSDFEANPKVAATPGGNFVFAWLKSGTANVITFQRLSATGLKMWGENGITLTGATGHSLSAPDVVGVDTDNAVAVWKNSTGQPWAPITWLYTQKFDPSGNQLWTTGGVLIYNAGHMSAWTYPEILSDASGGAFFCWYDSPSLSDFSVSVAHVNASGSLVFPLNGVLASTNTTRLHMNPSFDYVPGGGGLYVFWNEANLNQTQYAVYGQNISSLGTRLWSDDGREFVPLSSNQISFVRCAAAGLDLYVNYFEAPTVTSNAVKTFKVDPGGGLLWGPTLLSSATLGGKDDLEMVVNRENRAFLTWSDGRSDFADIYAQNVNPNGTLGNLTTASLDVTLEPANPIHIGPQGGHFHFNCSAQRVVGPQAPFVVWARIKNPDGTYTNPTLGPITINPPVGIIVTRMRTQTVPGTWLAGVYTYLGYANTTYSYPAIDSSWFTFTKSSTGGGPWVDKALCFGEPFPGEEIPPLSRGDRGDLVAASPNPFNPATVASFELRVPSHVSLKVYDTAGRLVVTLVDGWREAGSHQVTFDGSNLASGMYFARLEADGFSALQKLVLMK